MVLIFGEEIILPGCDGATDAERNARIWYCNKWNEINELEWRSKCDGEKKKNAEIRKPHWPCKLLITFSACRNRFACKCMN